MRRSFEKTMLAYPHERFSSEVALSPKIVRDYALAVGDTNPVHHDADFAATTRYGRLIASGAHTAALLFALTASHFSAKGSVVGLEFRVRYRRPVYADETIQLEWLVRKVTPNAKLGGHIVELRGRIKGGDGKTSMGATGRVMVTERL
ncbi:MAG: MaoC family dehydratase [Burkholderiales bacterium]|nr:MaoC family dehydratase [Burkholderiales bacterium]